MPFALITGASQGIGKSIAEELAGRGKDVLLVARNADQLGKVCKELEQAFNIKAFYLSTDLSKDLAAEEVLAWCRQRDFTVDVLVNNAGYGLSGVFDELSLREQLDMMQVNMNAVVSLTHLFLPLLRKQSKAWILNIGSSAGYQATPYLSVYGASKAFVRSFSRALRQELKGSAVSITCVNPGPTDTAFNQRARVGAKARAYSGKLHQPAKVVARLAVTAMYKGRAEVITGTINKLGAFAAWLLPANLVEGSAAKIYR